TVVLISPSPSSWADEARMVAVPEALAVDLACPRATVATQEADLLFEPSSTFASSTSLPGRSAIRYRSVTALSAAIAGAARGKASVATQADGHCCMGSPSRVEKPKGAANDGSATAFRQPSTWGDAFRRQLQRVCPCRWCQSARDSFGYPSKVSSTGFTCAST